MTSTNLTPDDNLMEQIFPDLPHTSTVILAQNFTECSFLATPTKSDHDTADLQPPVVVRISLRNDESLRLREVSTMSSIAALVIPELVPMVKKVGIAHMLDKRVVEFSIIEFIPNATALEGVWDGLSDDGQRNIVTEVVAAMTKLQSLRVSEPRVQKYFNNLGVMKHGVSHGDKTTSLYIENMVGGPTLGFHSTMACLLQSIVDSQNRPTTPTSMIEIDSDGSVAIKSTYPNVSAVKLSHEDLSCLQSDAVLCHNDLEPRNLMVRRSTNNGATQYHLVSIIDWEQAAFVPFGYDYILKDQMLGSSNLQYSWYSLFKAISGKSQVLRGQELFMQAVDVIHQSFIKNKRRNVGLAVREKWIARELLNRDKVFWRGWVRREGAGAVKRYRASDNQELLEETLVELGIV